LGSSREVTMDAFEDLHRDRVTGSLAMFDRMIFKGRLTSLYKENGAKCFLWSQGVALKDFTPYAKWTTAKIADTVRGLAEEAGRPVISFDHVKTRNFSHCKDELAKRIAAEDGITEGIICVISAVETCMSFQVRKSVTTRSIVMQRRERKCLHHYLYLMDPEFGFMHVRIQGWIPYDVQIYINGREWLARQLDRAGIGYARWDNALVRVDDLEAAARLCGRFAHKAWPRVLNAFARRVNPMMPIVRGGQLRRLLLGAGPGRDRHRRHVQLTAQAARHLARPRAPCGAQPGIRGRARVPGPQAAPIAGRRGGGRHEAAPRGLAGPAPHGPQLGEGLRQGVRLAGRDGHQQSARVSRSSGSSPTPTGPARAGGVPCAKACPTCGAATRSASPPTSATSEPSRQLP
jgi:hypothetical protein